MVFPLFFCLDFVYAVGKWRLISLFKLNKGPNMKYFLIILIVLFSFQSLAQEKKGLVHYQAGQQVIDII